MIELNKFLIFLVFIDYKILLFIHSLFLFAVSVLGNMVLGSKTS